MKKLFTTMSDVLPIKQGGTDKLGEGSFSKVKLVSHRLNPKKLYAMKTVAKKGDRERQLIYKEIKLHRSLDHPNIIKFEDYIEEKNEVFIFLEYAKNKDLFTQINLFKHSEAELLKFFYQTCLAIQYLHARNIMHRDLKPENILMDEQMNVKVCDFGWSTEYLENVPRETLCGTYEYMSPEVLVRSKQTKKTDVWALGILLYELFHGCAPFKGSRMEEILEQITKNRIVFKKNIDPDVKDLIMKILKFDPRQRPDIDSVLAHPLILKYRRNILKEGELKEKGQLEMSESTTESFFADIQDKILESGVNKVEGITNQTFAKNPLKCQKNILGVDKKDDFFELANSDKKVLANTNIPENVYVKWENSPQETKFANVEHFPQTSTFAKNNQIIKRDVSPIANPIQLGLKINLGNKFFAKSPQPEPQGQLTNLLSPPSNCLKAIPSAELDAKANSNQNANKILGNSKVFASMRNLGNVPAQYSSSRNLNLPSNSRNISPFNPSSKSPAPCSSDGKNGNPKAVSNGYLSSRFVDCPKGREASKDRAFKNQIQPRFPAQQDNLISNAKSKGLSDWRTKSPVYPKSTSAITFVDHVLTNREQSKRQGKIISMVNFDLEGRN